MPLVASWIDAKTAAAATTNAARIRAALTDRAVSDSPGRCDCAGQQSGRLSGLDVRHPRADGDPLSDDDLVEHVASDLGARDLSELLVADRGEVFDDVEVIVGHCSSDSLQVTGSWG